MGKLASLGVARVLVHWPAYSFSGRRLRNPRTDWRAKALVRSRWRCQLSASHDLAWDLQRAVESLWAGALSPSTTPPASVAAPIFSPSPVHAPFVVQSWRPLHERHRTQFTERRLQPRCARK